mmetsp:Transcript_63762/g.178429  ORF Transcript_63762/g.178429 Transcript_63762/m.178429 type:complete len:633 (+) Transcript_63762:280-2178(+)
MARRVRIITPAHSKDAAASTIGELDMHEQAAVRQRVPRRAPQGEPPEALAHGVQRHGPPRDGPRPRGRVPHLEGEDLQRRPRHVEVRVVVEDGVEAVPRGGSGLRALAAGFQADLDHGTAGVGVRPLDRLGLVLLRRLRPWQAVAATDPHAQPPAAPGLATAEQHGALEHIAAAAIVAAEEALAQEHGAVRRLVVERHHLHAASPERQGVNVRGRDHPALGVGPREVVGVPGAQRLLPGRLPKLQQLAGRHGVHLASVPGLRVAGRVLRLFPPVASQGALLALRELLGRQRDAAVVHGDARAAAGAGLDEYSAARRPWRDGGHPVPIDAALLLVPRRREEPISQHLHEDFALLGQLRRGAVLLDGHNDGVFASDEGVVGDRRDDVVEERLGGHGVAVLHDRLSVGAVPNVDLDRAAASSEHLDVAENGGAAAQLVPLEVGVMGGLDEVRRQRLGHVLEHGPCCGVDERVAGGAEELREALVGEDEAGRDERRVEQTEQSLHLRGRRPWRDLLHVPQERCEPLAGDASLAALLVEVPGPRNGSVHGLRVQGLDVLQHALEVGESDDPLAAPLCARALQEARQRPRALVAVDVQVPPQSLYGVGGEAGTALPLDEGEHPLDAAPLPQPLRRGPQ